MKFNISAVLQTCILPLWLRNLFSAQSLRLVFYKNTTSSLCIESSEWTSHLCTVCSALGTKIPHRWAKRHPRSGEHQTTCWCWLLQVIESFEFSARVQIIFYIQRSLVCDILTFCLYKLVVCCFWYRTTCFGQSVFNWIIYFLCSVNLKFHKVIKLTTL